MRLKYNAVLTHLAAALILPSQGAALRNAVRAKRQWGFFEKMSTSSQLSTALENLNTALVEAEAAAEARRAADAAQESSVADSSGLESALAELRSDYAILKAAADDVTRRLDGTIVRVEAILAGRN